ncbi:MAG TPA: hypothetical protein VL122_00535 [Nitrospirota bacterium]|nr:hypothetical protein [Nitrospirota bacterium]
MKATLSVLIVVVLALTVGVAYAGSAMTASKAEIPLNNGVTYFNLEPTPDCSSVSGAAAGAVIPTAEPELMNGVTYFELGTLGPRSFGQCAGNISEEKPSAGMNNGITVFE